MHWIVKPKMLVLKEGQMYCDMNECACDFENFVLLLAFVTLNPE